MSTGRTDVVTVRRNAQAEQQDLIDRCLAGDPAAWDVVVRTHWKRVFNVAYKFVGRYDDAEDLTQEIFVRLLRALPTYDRRANFETWLAAEPGSVSLRDLNARD